MSAVKTKPPEHSPFPSADRAALAQAIAGRAERVARLEGLGEAVRSATAEYRAACRVVDDAVAQEAERAHMYGRAPDATVVTEDAKRSVEVTREALRAAKAELEDAEHQHDFSLDRIDIAARAVLRAELSGDVAAWGAELERQQREQFKLGEKLRWMISRGVIPLPTRSFAERTAVDNAIGRFENCAPSGWGAGSNYGPLFPVPTEVLALEAWLEALKRDANAPMPDLTIGH
jgi:hypothetical protein